MCLWLKMGWAGGDGSSLVPMNTEMLLEPTYLEDSREATALSSLTAKKLKVPKAFFLSKLTFVMDPHVLLGKASLGSRCWGTGSPCVSSPFVPTFAFPTVIGSWIGVCWCLMGLSLEAEGTGGGWGLRGGSAWVPGGMCREESWLCADLWV